MGAASRSPPPHHAWLPASGARRKLHSPGSGVAVLSPQSPHPAPQRLLRGPQDLQTSGLGRCGGGEAPLLPPRDPGDTARPASPASPRLLAREFAPRRSLGWVGSPRLNPGEPMDGYGLWRNPSTEVGPPVPRPPPTHTPGAPDSETEAGAGVVWCKVILKVTGRAGGCGAHSCPIPSQTEIKAGRLAAGGPGPGREGAGGVGRGGLAHLPKLGFPTAPPACRPPHPNPTGRPWRVYHEGDRLTGWPLQPARWWGSVPLHPPPSPPGLPARVDSQLGSRNQSDHFAHFPTFPGRQAAGSPWVRLARGLGCPQGGWQRVRSPPLGAPPALPAFGSSSPGARIRGDLPPPAGCAPPGGRLPGGRFQASGDTELSPTTQWLRRGQSCARPAPRPQRGASEIPSNSPGRPRKGSAPLTLPVDGGWGRTAAPPVPPAMGPPVARPDPTPEAGVERGPGLHLSPVGRGSSARWGFPGAAPEGGRERETVNREARGAGGQTGGPGAGPSWGL